MERVIKIAGADRTADILLESFRIEQVLTSQEDTCSFIVKSGAKPATGDEIIVLDGTTKLFAGIIDQVKSDHRPANITRYNCEARDYTYQINKRLVVEDYATGRATVKRADEILVDIATRYCTGFTTANVQTDSPEVDAITFDYVQPAESFKQLCNYVGWEWYVDFDKDIHFFDPSEFNEPAPVVIDSSANYRSFKYDLDMQDLRNRVYVRGGTYLSDYVTYEYKADGVQRAWTLPYKPHSLTISVGGGAAITPGIENIDDETAKSWMMNYQEKLIRLAASMGDIASGTTVAFTFKFDIDVITEVEDTDSQLAVAAVQGGDGVYEHIIVDDSLTTIEAAEASGNADLREHANPQVKGSFITETPGWAPGQLVQINLPTQGIVNTYVVQKVGISVFTPTLWSWKIDFGGRLIGIADFLKALVSSQQSKKTGDTAILHKFTYGADSAALTDEIASTYRTPPFICGDVDAICGFVLCST